MDKVCEMCGDSNQMPLQNRIVQVCSPIGSFKNWKYIDEITLHTQMGVLRSDNWPACPACREKYKKI